MDPVTQTSIIADFGPLIAGGGICAAILFFFLRYLGNTKVLKKQIKKDIKQHNLNIDKSKKDMVILNKKVEDVKNNIQTFDQISEKIDDQIETKITNTIARIDNPLKNKSIENTNRKIDAIMEKIRNSKRRTIKPD